MPAGGRSFPALMVGAGFAMAMTAPIELLYARQFGVNAVALTAYIAMAGVGVMSVDVLGTRFVPRLDARTIMSAGTLCFALGCASLALSPSFWPLLPARAVQGFGSGLFLGAALQAAVRLHPVRHQALVAFNSSFLLGGALGAPVGGIIAGVMPGRAGFRLAFVVCVALSIVVALSQRARLDPLPAAVEAGRPVIGWPRLAGSPGLGPALLLGTLGDLLRGSVVYTALPLVGQARHLSTATIGVAVGLLLAVEIVAVRFSAPILVRFGPARCLAVALACGVGIAMTLALTDGPTSFLTCAACFGVVIAAATIAPPLVLVAVAGNDDAAGLASYRMASGVGMVAGSAGAGAVAAALGATPVFLVIAGVLALGVVLARNTESE